MPRVVITGASGLLGRALYDEFTKQSWEVLGFAYSRAKGKLKKINLHDSDEVKAILQDFKPDVIIHAAAERSPEKVEKNYGTSVALNVNCSKILAQIAGELKAAFLYISTDYVFDGENPPYSESDIPNPLNKYGLSKWTGEKEVVISNPDSCILRIPVLYGNEEFIGESAISSLLKNLLSTGSSDVGVSNFETRFPSHTNDIAAVCYQLMECKLQDPSLKSVFHWCGSEALTKYDMVLILAEVFSLPHSHIVPIDDCPLPDAQCKRPKNTQLSCERLKNLGVGQHTSFKVGVMSFEKFVCEKK